MLVPLRYFPLSFGKTQEIAKVRQILVDVICDVLTSTLLNFQRLKSQKTPSLYFSTNDEPCESSDKISNSGLSSLNFSI